MSHSIQMRNFLLRLHAAGGLQFIEDGESSGQFHWRVTLLDRWPLEVQIDRWALMIRCYVGDELLCTGRVREEEADQVIAPSSGSGDAAVLQELAEFVDGVMRSDSRRFLQPPHADRHPDRRSDPEHDATIRSLPGRTDHKPA
ncbi:MAG: hypothetical protein ACYTDX_06940 [Planctomycetota bacterium]|jgi:hypothetical protein